MDQSIKNKTVEIRKACKTKLPDAVISATAIVNNMTLISRNSSDFGLITELNIINPWDI
jgi:predicted nucleic acid-binding protein